MGEGWGCGLLSRAGRVSSASHAATCPLALLGLPALWLILVTASAACLGSWEGSVRMDVVVLRAEGVQHGCKTEGEPAGAALGEPARGAPRDRTRSYMYTPSGDPSGPPKAGEREPQEPLCWV